MEMRFEVEDSMRRNAALSPMALSERKRRDDGDCEAAIALIRKTRQASISHFQLSLGWVYNRASRILDLLRKLGIVGEKNGERSYEILKVVEQEA